MRKMKVIQHNVVAQRKDTPITGAHKIRVAAYCRVSTLEEEQELSYEASGITTQHYLKMIQPKPW